MRIERPQHPNDRRLVCGVVVQLFAFDIVFLDHPKRFIEIFSIRGISLELREMRRLGAVDPAEARPVDVLPVAGWGFAAQKRADEC